MHLQCLALLAISAVLAECTTNFSRPVDPFDYQQALQQGFNSNYFKTGRFSTRIPYWYRRQYLQDVYDRGFRNFRIRINMEPYVRYMQGEYSYNPYERMLDKVEEIVNDCINVGLLPIIAWRQSAAEAYATETDHLQFLKFWRDMAERYTETNYRLSFHLVTELGYETCYAHYRRPGCNYNRTACCSESLTENKTKYHSWMSSAIRVIRESGGNNERRIVILPSPEKTETGLKFLNKDSHPYIANESYLMAEWHTHAAGPSALSYRRDWSGNGTERQREYILRTFRVAEQFTRDNRIPTFCGEWGAIDNQYASIPESIAISFARFLVGVLKAERIPWSLNAFEKFYDTRSLSNYGWRTMYTHEARLLNRSQQFNVSRILNAIIDEM